MESNITPTTQYTQVTVDVPQDRVAEFHAFFGRFLAGPGGLRRGRRAGHPGRGRHGHHGHHGRGCARGERSQQSESPQQSESTVEATEL